MARGGFRPGAGRPRKGQQKRPKKGVSGSDAEPASPEVDAKTPLDYMLAVMSNREADPNRRDRMAVAAAPFVHAKAGEGSKKESQAERAKKALGGRFAPPPPPGESKAH